MGNEAQKKVTPEEGDPGWHTLIDHVDGGGTHADDELKKMQEDYMKNLNKELDKKSTKKKKKKKKHHSQAKGDLAVVEYVVKHKHQPHSKKNKHRQRKEKAAREAAERELAEKKKRGRRRGVAVGKDGAGANVFFGRSIADAMALADASKTKAGRELGNTLTQVTKSKAQQRAELLKQTEAAAELMDQMKSM